MFERNRCVFKKVECHLFCCNTVYSTGSDFCGTDKSSTVGCLSKCCDQGVSQLFCWWGTLNIVVIKLSPAFYFWKISITVAEIVLIQVFFLPVGSKQKNKNELAEHHGMFIPFKSRVYSKHRSPIFHLFASWKMVLYFHV